MKTAKYLLYGFSIAFGILAIMFFITGIVGDVSALVTFGTICLVCFIITLVVAIILTVYGSKEKKDKITHSSTTEKEPTYTFGGPFSGTFEGPFGNIFVQLNKMADMMKETTQDEKQVEEKKIEDKPIKTQCENCGSKQLKEDGSCPYCGQK